MIKQGVNKSARGYSAVYYAPKASLCRIRLYHHGSDEVTDTFSMEKDSEHRGFFACNFQTDAGEYLFECDGETVADPYATAFAGKENFFDEKVTARCVLPGKNLRFADVKHPSRPFSDLIIYKLHVRGFTNDSSSKVAHPGTFAGVTEKIRYIKGLGVNAVLLMPCYEFDEAMPKGFREKPKANFWGYGAHAYYFAPKQAYAADKEDVTREFAGMVKAFHRAGIEVLMEMHFTPDISDVTALEALRFWHEIYHIDGFRLMGGAVSLKMTATDPWLAGVKLISDRTFDTVSAQADTAVTDDSFMTTARRFLKGDENMISDFAAAVKDKGGSSARVNYFTDHDSFTLADVYSYDVKHNESNLESNRDGREVNYSWNCGMEGDTANKKIISLRRLMCRNAMATLLLSQGTPLIMAGDEFMSTHKGNNNPYCCDNEEGWVVWNHSAQAREMTEFVRKLILLRSSHRAFANPIPLRGTDYIYKGSPDISYHGIKAWYPDFGYYSRTLGIMLNGDYALTGRNSVDDSFYIAFNMHWEEHEFGLPVTAKDEFELLLSTDGSVKYSGGRSVNIPARCIAVFRKRKGEQ